jgi:hypothetical protein
LGSRDAEVAILLEELGELSEHAAVEFDGFGTTQASHPHLVA